MHALRRALLWDGLAPRRSTGQRDLPKPPERHEIGYAQARPKPAAPALPKPPERHSTAFAAAFASPRNSGSSMGSSDGAPTPSRLSAEPRRTSYLLGGARSSASGARDYLSRRFGGGAAAGGGSGADGGFGRALGIVPGR